MVNEFALREYVYIVALAFGFQIVQMDFLQFAILMNFYYHRLWRVKGKNHYFWFHWCIMEIRFYGNQLYILSVFSFPFFGCSLTFNVCEVLFLPSNWLPQSEWKKIVENLMVLKHSRIKLYHETWIFVVLF